MYMEGLLLKTFEKNFLYTLYIIAFIVIIPKHTALGLYSVL